MQSAVSSPRHPAVAAVGALPALRAATRSHHDRLDALIDLRRLGERAYYARVLQVFDAFLPAWEAGVAAALPAARQAWLRRRSRCPFLQQDLRVLGIAPLPRGAALPALSSAAAAWGAIYVVEGSALGSQLITRTLARSGWLPERGAAYFHGWGEATGSMWRETRGLLESELADAASVAQACQAARATFDALAGQLERTLHERAPAA